MSVRIASVLHANCTKSGAMQFERLKGIARLHSIPALHGDCCAIALLPYCPVGPSQKWDARGEGADHG